MWSWHWSPLTQTSRLLSPSDGLASFLETTLGNGVKVVEKVITSKFRFQFHLIAIYAFGVFSQYQLHSCTRITLDPPPNTRETSGKMNFNVIDKKQLTWELFIYWYLMSFFHIKMSQNCWATIMPFGPVTNFLQAEFFFSSLWLLALISGTEAICKTDRIWLCHNKQYVKHTGSGYVLINSMLNRQYLVMS